MVIRGRKERVRLRAARFGRLMDRVDGDWRTPAQLERFVCWVYRNLTL